MTDLASDWQHEFGEYDDAGDTGSRVVERGQRQLLPIAIGVSLLVHGAIASLLLTMAARDTPQPVLPAVRISLVAENPYSVTEPAPLPTPTPAEPEAPPDNPPADALVAVAEEAVPREEQPPPVDAVVTAEPLPAEPPVEFAPVAPVPNSPIITLPSLTAVRQSIERVNAESAARSWLYECNRLEEDAGVRTCERTARSDYATLARNPHYLALNPVREQSRTTRSLATVYQQTDAVAEALAASAIPEALADYVLGELEAGTSVHTNNGTDRVQHMRRMTDRSDAGVMAERALGDSWLQGRAAELQQRRVHAN